MIYAGKILNLGRIERVQAEKKPIENPFLKERRTSIEDYQIIESSRSIQQKVRHPMQEEKLPSSDKPNDLRFNFSSGEMNKEEEFQKVQSSAPITIRRVETNEDGSQTQVEMEAPKNHKDQLFSNFLNNLQSESISKVKKKKKRHKESDIIQMFKSVQTANSKADGDQNSNIILKSNKNGKLR